MSISITLKFHDCLGADQDSYVIGGVFDGQVQIFQKDLQRLWDEHKYCCFILSHDMKMVTIQVAN